MTDKKQEVEETVENPTEKLKGGLFEMLNRLRAENNASEQRDYLLANFIAIFDVSDSKQDAATEELIKTDFKKAVALAIIQSFEARRVQDVLELRTVIAILKNVDGILKDGVDVDETIRELEDFIKEEHDTLDEEEGEAEVPTVPTKHPEE